MSRAADWYRRALDATRPWRPGSVVGFSDPFGHLWLVGDRSPLQRFP
jgi:hypothetical protein